MIKFGVTQIYKYEIKNLDLDMLLYFAMYNEHPYFGPKLSGKKPFILTFYFNSLFIYIEKQNR